MKPTKPKLSEAQRRQRAIYQAQMSTPKKPGNGEARALHRITGLGVGR